MHEIPGMAAVARKGGPAFDLRLKRFGGLLLNMERVEAIQTWTDPKDNLVAIVYLASGETIDTSPAEAAALISFVGYYPDEFAAEAEAGATAADGTGDEDPTAHWRHGPMGG